MLHYVHYIVICFYNVPLFLSGDSYMSHSYSFRVAPNTIGKIVPETCRALFTVLRKDYFSCPTTVDEWRSVADGYWKKWQFPNTIGALDGKHIVLRQPINSGSTYFNYKNCFSIVLMALVDSDYKFIYVNCGTQGRISDGGVFSATTLYKRLESKTFNLPEPTALPGDNEVMPYFMIADEAFPLRSYLMKPYPHRNLNHHQRIYNYRLSRARRIVENAFGILASRFRVMLSPMQLSPNRAEIVVLACCALHNLLRIEHPSAILNMADREDPVTHNCIPGVWRNMDTLHDLDVMRGNNATKAAKAQRDYLCAYVNSDIGKVAWQDRMV